MIVGDLLLHVQRPMRVLNYSPVSCNKFHIDQLFAHFLLGPKLVSLYRLPQNWHGSFQLELQYFRKMIKLFA